MKIKKASKNHALLLLGGASAALAGNSATLSTVHADTAKTTKVSANNETTQINEQGQKVTKIDSSKSSVASDMEIVTVVEGDTTWDIAQEHDTTVEQIVKDNDLKNGGSLIHVGDKLKVHAANGTTAQNSTTPATSVQQAPEASTDSTTTNSGADTSSAQTASSQNYSSSSQSQTSSYSGYNSTTTQSNYSSNYQAPANSTTTQKSQTTTYKSNVAGDETAAKEWIAARESGGSYTARNASSGAYGRYQLLPGYLKGDYSPANQEKVADNYVKSRYGSWTNAKAFWQTHNWY